MISYKFYLSAAAGLSIPYQEVSAGKKGSPAVSVGLGMIEYDKFHVGGNFAFFPSLDLISLLAEVGMRLDSENFTVSLGGATGPSVVFRGDKSYANLALSSGIKIGAYIVPLRLIGFFLPTFSAHLGPLGGYMVSILVGFDLLAER